jgi:tripartite ATP-independent transporter DctM subunit
MLFVTLIGLTLFFLLTGLWVAASLGIAGIIGLYVAGYTNLIHVVGAIPWYLAADFTLTAIPLFLFMGEIVLGSGMSRSFYHGVAKITNKIPGGLLHSNIVASAIFSAISGSSVATAAGIGSVAIKEQKSMGYKPTFIYGSVAAGGTLGILIPPSISLIIYGALTSTSVVQLFTAALIPGIILTGLYMIFILVVSLTHKKEFENVDISDLERITYFEAIKGILPFVLLIATVLGGIYSGVMTPTEAASVGVALSIVFGKVAGNLSFKNFKRALLNSVKTTAMIMFIMLGAQIFSYTLNGTGAGRHLVSWLIGLGLSKFVFLAVVYVIYIILGCFVDGNSMQFMTIPILFPVILAYEFNPVWFGVVLVVLIEMGQITPPMGLNVFVIHGIDKESTLASVIRGTIPYFCVMLIELLLLTIFPRIITFLVV